MQNPRKIYGSFVDYRTIQYIQRHIINVLGSLLVKGLPIALRWSYAFSLIGMYENKGHKIGSIESQSLIATVDVFVFMTTHNKKNLVQLVEGCSR